MASNQRAKRFLTLSQHVEINKRPKKSWILLFKGKKTQNKSHKFFPLSHTHTVCSSAAGPQWKGQSWSREERTRPGHQLSKKHRAGSFQMAIVTSSGLRSQPEELWPAKVKTALLSGRTWTTNPKVFRDTRLLFWKMIHPAFGPQPSGCLSCRNYSPKRVKKWRRDDGIRTSRLCNSDLGNEKAVWTIAR